MGFFFFHLHIKFLLNKKIKNQSSYCSPLLYHHEITVGPVCYEGMCYAGKQAAAELGGSAGFWSKGVVSDV